MSAPKQGIRVFKGRELDMIAMPIGGIGTGCVSLGGWGQLQDWEIFGRPGKGTVNDMAFFTLHAREAKRGGASVTKVLQGPAGGPRMGPPTSVVFWGGGSGNWGRGQAAGLPHFTSCAFAAHYPFADVSLADGSMPLRATLTAWNPFIPLNDRDSSIPCAIFQWRIANPTRRSFACTLFANLTNLTGYPETGRGFAGWREEAGVRGIAFTTRRHPESSPRFGTLALATSHPSTTHLTHWLRSGWFDPLTDFWRQACSGQLDETVPAEEAPADRNDTSSIGLRFRLAAGEERVLPIVIAWHSPTYEMYWGKPGADGKLPCWSTYTASLWKDAWDVAAYALANLARLERETRAYDEALRSSTVPQPVLESVQTTSSTLKSPTCLRLPGGELWGWEGCHDQAGCCEGTCTHVWNYQQMVASLFPRLERGMRELEYTHAISPDGHVVFRLPLPLGTPPSSSFHAAADGQLGGLLRLYRDWRLSGDDAWLARLWPAAKSSLEFAWKHWDRDRDGVLEGVQHNTYDIEFWGPNTLCGSLYLGALRAGEEIARHLGDDGSAERYRKLFDSGRAWMDEHLWNGEFFVQKVDPNAGQDDPYHRPAGDRGPSRDSTGMPKYQYGEGCLSDQLLGQMYAGLLELGDLLHPAHLDAAARSIHRYNFRRGFYDHANVQRIYAQDEESGLLACTWPRGGMPEFPFPYSDEVWTGIEYAAAALLAGRGLVRQAVEIVQAIRKRHDGTRRNPFDEFECGHHYARAMASWAVFLALTGCSADLPNRRLAFAPKVAASGRREFATFFSVDTGWGVYRRRATGSVVRHDVDVRAGAVELAVLSVAGKESSSAAASLGGKRVPATIRAAARGIDVVLSRAVRVRPGAPLSVTVRS